MEKPPEIIGPEGELAKEARRYGLGLEISRYYEGVTACTITSGFDSMPVEEKKKAPAEIARIASKIKDLFSEKIKQENLHLRLDGGKKFIAYSSPGGDKSGPAIRFYLENFANGKESEKTAQRKNWIKS